MPLGDVSLLEFQEAIAGKLEESSPMFKGRVVVVEADEDTEVETLSKSLGTSRYGVRVLPGSPALMIDSTFTNGVIFSFHALVVILFRRRGTMGKRTSDDRGRDITAVTKAVIMAIQNERLSILNTKGVSCGFVTYSSDGTSLQAMTFTASGSSREART